MDPTTYGSPFTPDLSSGVSNNLWNQGGGCPRDQIRNGYTRGVYFDTDYVDVPLIGTQTAEVAIGGGLKGFNSGAGTIVSKSAINGVETPGGILAVALADADDSGSFAQSYPSFLLNGSEDTTGKLWFEHKLSVSTLLTNGLGFILGLAETELWTLATGVPMAGGDALTAAASFIGFNKLEDGLGVLNTVKSDRAAGAPTIIQASAGVLTAAFTFVKLGMFYDPGNVQECVSFYINGVKCTNVLTKAQLQAHVNLDANCLGLIFASVADTPGGLASETFHDWTKIYQLLP